MAPWRVPRRRFLRMKAPSFSGDSLIYVGFWPRLAASLLDFAVLAPYALLAMRLASISPLGFVTTQVIGTVLAVVFDIVLVKLFGGSPGKLIMKMRIAKLDGSRVGYREAWLRYSVLGVISILASVALSTSALKMSDTDFVALTNKTRGTRLRELAPPWYQPLEIAGQVWVGSEFVVLLTNRKRRALHDYLAGTVVIRRIGKQQ